jgi:serine/threonine protein kinase
MLAGRYQILEPIASGGMAEVFKAKLKGPQGFEKIVAVKRILAAFSSDKEFREMFIDEAKISTILTHTNIVQVHELGEEEGSLYIVMEFVDGGDLKTFIARKGPAGLRIHLSPTSEGRRHKRFIMPIRRELSIRT